MTSHINALPAEGLVRASAILGDKAKGLPAIFPVGQTSWWNGVRSGRYPQPVRIGVKAVAWRVEDLRLLLAGTYKPASGSAP
jgi:prophage regulatory protein